MTSIPQALDHLTAEGRDATNKLNQMREALMRQPSSVPKQISMGGILRLRRESIIIEDHKSYVRLTVQLRSRGVVERDRVLGAHLKTKKQQVVKTDDLVVAEIDAKMGGFGLVPPELSGAIVSSHYYLYEVDTSMVNLAYLQMYLRSGQPEHDLQQFVKGAVNYASIRAEDFGKITFPWVSLDEQVGVSNRLALMVSATKQYAEILDAIGKLSGQIYSKAFQGGLPG